jgi:hypothetical protein
VTPITAKQWKRIQKLMKGAVHVRSHEAALNLTPEQRKEVTDALRRLWEKRARDLDRPEGGKP